MNRVLVDTSAILALLVPTDRFHRQARSEFERVRERRATLLASSFVLVETYTLIGRRLGIAAVRRFREDFAPLLQVIWITPEIHERATDLWLADGRRRLSLVDAATLVLARDSGVDGVFGFDRHLAVAAVPARI